MLGYPGQTWTNIDFFLENSVARDSSCAHMLYYVPGISIADLNLEILKRYT